MSAAVIGALRANLSLNSAQFTSGVQQARGQLSVLRNSFAAAAGAAVALGAALSAAAMAGADRIDLLAKNARRLESSNTGFRVLEMAAGEAGVTVESLTDTLQKMNMVIGEGGPAAVAALGRLGLTLTDLEGLEADQKMAAIADGVQKAGLSASQTSSVLKDLGVKSREMVLALEAGGDVFRSAREDVLSYGLAVSTIDSDRIEEANDRIGRLGLITEYVQNQLALKMVPAFGQLALAMTDSLREGGLLRTVIDGLIGNMERLGTYIAVAVSGFGIRYVAALVAARLATLTLAGAMTFLKGAIMRTGLGALIVLAGEAIYQFSKLVEKVGGLGAAFSMLKDVAYEAWDRISSYGGAAVAKIVAGWYELRADIFDVLQSAATAVVGFGNRVIGVMSGALAAIKSIWGSLPGSIADFAYQAANGLISGVEAMLNAVVVRINAMVGAMNSALEMLPGSISIGLLTEVDLGGIENPYAGQAAKAGEEAGAAFNAALEKTYVEAPDMFAGIADEARDQADRFLGASDTLMEAAQKPMTAWQALKDVMTSSAEEGTAALDEAAAAAGSLDAALDDALANDGAGGGSGGGKSPAQQAVEELTDAAKRSQSAFETLRDGGASAFAGIVTGSKTARQAVGELLGNLAEMIASNAFKMLFTNTFGAAAAGGGGGWGMLGNLLGGAFANGTPSAPGGLSLVGERGPELVNLPRGSRVHTAQETSRMMGGTFDIVLHVPEGVTAEQVQGIAAGVSVRVVSQTATAQRRGLNGSVSDMQRRGI